MATGLGRWEVVTVGTGSAVEIDNTKARNGRQSAKFTAVSGATSEAYIRRKSHRPITGRIGLEGSFSVSTLNATSGAYVELFIADSSLEQNRRQSYSLIVDLNDEELLRLGPSASSVLVSEDTSSYTGTLTDDGNWNTVKMVVNTYTGEYEKFLLNNTLFNLRGAPANLEAFVPSEGDRLHFIARVHGGVGGDTVVHWDDIIFTQNEPELG